jgi:predicted glutamine amidotransferase
MCCLFGILDYKQTLSQKQLNKMVAVLSKACEVRGTDATGIAYNYNDKLCIFKRPLPAHRMHYRIPDGAHHIMGHTRMATQGNEKFNYNNHPFLGKADNTDFALAHNGVLYNDCRLKYGISSAINSRQEQVLRRSLKWQNVVSAVRALCSVKTFLTLIAKPTELGSPTSAR